MSALIDHLIWWAAILMGAGVIAISIRRKAYRHVPFFFAFVVASFLRDIGLMIVYYATRPKYLPYFASYWSTEALTQFLSFCMVREALLELVRSYPTLCRLTGRALRIAAFGIGLVALGSGIMGNGPDSGRLISGILMFSRSQMVIQSGMILFLVAYTIHFGVPWSKPAFLSAVGLSALTTMQLVGIAIRIRFGEGSAEIYRVLNGSAFVIALMFWFVGYLRLSGHASVGVIQAEIPSLADQERILVLIRQ